MIFKLVKPIAPLATYSRVGSRPLDVILKSADLDVYDVIWEGPVRSVDADELVLPEAVDLWVPEDADRTELRHRLAQVVVLFHPVQREPHVKLQVVVVQSETVLNM